MASSKVAKQHPHKERTLVILVGLSPAVVTETVYALASDPTDPFIPTQLLIVTTRRGKAGVEQTLLPGAHGEGALEALVRDYKNLGLRAALLKSTRVLVALDHDGNELDDDAHEALSLDRMGDLILATVVESANRPDSRLILGVSGGRKSMSYLAGLAMTLVARPQDRLVHVLLNDPRLERVDPPYFYPPKQPIRYVHTPPGIGKAPVWLTAENCDFGVTLAEIPLLRLGALMPTELRKAHIDPQRMPRLSELVRRAQEVLVLDAIRLEFVRNPRSKSCVVCNGLRIPLSPDQFALLHCIADQGEAGFGSAPSDADMAAFDAAMLRYARDEAAAEEYEDARAARIRNCKYFYESDGRFYGLDDDWPAGTRTPLKVQHLQEARRNRFNPIISKIRKRFEAVLGSTLANRALPPDSERGGRRRFPADVHITPAQPLVRR